MIDFFLGGVVLKIINPTWVLSQGAYKARWPNYQSWFQPTTNWVTLDQLTFWCLSFLIYKMGTITAYLTGLCGIKWVIHGKHWVFIVKPSNEWRFVLQENKSTLLPFFSFEKVTVSGCKLPHRLGIFKIIWWQLSFLVLLLPSQSTALPVQHTSQFSFGDGSTFPCCLLAFTSSSPISSSASFLSRRFSLSLVHLVKNAQNVLLHGSPLWAVQKNFSPPLTTGFYMSKDKWHRSKAS